MTLWTVAHQAPPLMGFPRREYWSGLPFPSPWDLPNPGMEPMSPALTGGFFTAKPPGKPLPSPEWECQYFRHGKARQARVAGSCSTQHKSQNEVRRGAPGSEKPGGHQDPTGLSRGPSLKSEAWGERRSWSQQGRDPALPRQSIATGRGCWASLPGAQGKREKTGLTPASGHSS